MISTWSITDGINFNNLAKLFSATLLTVKLHASVYSIQFFGSESFSPPHTQGKRIKLHFLKERLSFSLSFLFSPFSFLIYLSIYPSIYYISIICHLELFFPVYILPSETLILVWKCGITIFPIFLVRIIKIGTNCQYSSISHSTVQVLIWWLEWGYIPGDFPVVISTLLFQQSLVGFQKGQCLSIRLYQLGHKDSAPNYPGLGTPQWCWNSNTIKSTLQVTESSWLTWHVAPVESIVSSLLHYSEEYCCNC